MDGWPKTEFVGAVVFPNTDVGCWVCPKAGCPKAGCPNAGFPKADGDPPPSAPKPEAGFGKAEFDPDANAEDVLEDPNEEGFEPYGESVAPPLCS